METEIKWIPGEDLLSVNRLDLLAKYVYVESKRTGMGYDWALELYSRHIEAFSGGSFQEPQNDEKNSLEKYIECFDELIENIQKYNFDVNRGIIPVSGGVILDGAHRTAIAAYFGLKVPCVYKNFEKAYYDYRFFQKMYLGQEYIDAMVTKYVEICGKNCYVFCIWPKADRRLLERAEVLIKEKANNKIVAEKSIHITYQGLKNLMIQVYAEHDWVGSVEDHFRGVEGKVDLCYGPSEILKTYIVEMPTPESVIDLKKKIRDLFGIGNDSVHSSDNYQETLSLTHLLFNGNSIDLLNYGKLDYDISFVNAVLKFRDNLKRKGYNTENFIIESSGIMGLYGIRKVGDLDYLTIEKEDIKFEEKEFDDHSNHSNYYTVTVDNLILNPRLYCYAFEMKFITLDVLKVFKNSRGQTKDKEDILLIEKKMTQSSSLAKQIKCSVIKIKREARNKKTKVRMYLERHNIHCLTKIWHLIVGKGYR